MRCFLGFCLLLAGAWAGMPAFADGVDPGDCSKNHYILSDPLACWQETQPLHLARTGHTATLLNDGRVLVAGGVAGARGGEGITSVEIFDPATGHWTLAAPLHAPRAGHNATRLADGRVLVLGGHDTYESHVWTIDNTGEIYDPGSDTWASVAGPLTPRDYYSVTLLADGRVLVVGGVDASDSALGSCELYDPATGKWTETGSLPPRVRHTLPPPWGTRAYGHTATLLADGRVLLAGGYDSDVEMAPVSEADVYDPATGQWTMAEMGASRVYHTATLLADGRVMVTGGDWPNCGGGAGCLDGVVMTTEIYDPRTNGWSAGPPLRAPRESYTATLLRDGSLLLVGGTRNNPGSPYSWTVLGEVDTSPAPGAPFISAPSLHTPREGHTTTLLADGSVLAVGGWGCAGAASCTPLGSAEIYRRPLDSTP